MDFKGCSRRASVCSPHAEQSWPPRFNREALVAQGDIVRSSEPQTPEFGTPRGEFSEFSTIL